MNTLRLIVGTERIEKVHHPLILLEWGTKGNELGGSTERAHITSVVARAAFEDLTSRTNNSLT